MLIYTLKSNSLNKKIKNSMGSHFTRDELHV